VNILKFAQLEFLQGIKKSTLYQSILVLSTSDRKKISFVILIQLGLGLLDLVAVIFIGALGALTVSGVQSKSAGSRVSDILNFLNLQDFSFQAQAGVLGSISAGLLISRTIFSIYFTRKTLRFLSSRGARITSELFHRLLAQPLLNIRNKSSQELLFALTNGVNTITLGVLGTGVSLIADTSLMIILGFGLFALDPVVATISLLLFGSVGLVLYRLLHVRARLLGSSQTELNILSAEKILEVLQTYRENFVRNRRAFYSREVKDLRFRLSDLTAELSFMPSISKYVIETSVVVGALLISAIQFVRLDANQAIATLAVFMAAGARIAPAVLRVQQGSILIRSSLGSAQTTLSLISELNANPQELPQLTKFSTTHDGFIATVEINNLKLTYPGADYPALSKITMSIEEGEFVAIVGESGAGKSSLADSILGVLIPQTGTVEISGTTPLMAIQKWPGSIAYVPQDIAIINGTISENISLGFLPDEYTEQQIKDSLVIAQLDKFVEELPRGLDTHVGENGSKLSGGQRQRLGIARALFTKPKLIIMDEATSSLDGVTEATVSGAIQSLRGKVTLIMIAHRLSTIRTADKVIYLSKGKIEAVGSFESVRSQIPDFDRQAQLMGL